MSEYILKMTDVEKSFIGIKALNKVSLAIKKGEIHCLAGENGSGKSTLIKIVSGVYTADGGTIEIDGTQYKKLTPIEAMLKGIQVIYQDFSIFPSLSVKENIVIYNQVASGSKLVNWKKIREKAQKAMDLIDLKLDPDAEVNDLSIADKQLVAICRALVNEAKLIIMDEPTTALTCREVNNLFKVIKNLQQQGIAILFVSHKIDEVFEISEKFTILRNGENVITGNTADLDDEKFAFYMTGRQFSRDSYAAPVAEGEPVMEVERLSLKNGFEDVSFSLHKGEILGITGLLGSGRTELALSLFGIRPADRGKIKIFGNEKKIRGVKDALEARIGYLPEDRLTEGLFMPQSIGDNIIVSKLDALASRWGFLNDKKCCQEIESWARELAIVTPNVGNPVQTLSGGNQQRVVLAKWLARDMDILILNGPTVGVDIGSKHDIYRILADCAGRGMAILVISDDLPEVRMLCNRILIMKDGRMAGQFDAVETTDEMLAQLVAGGTGASACEEGGLIS